MQRFYNQIQINDKIFLKDPNSSELGKKIVSNSILLIDEIGLESFTFKKLAKQLETTESSIYRYFENKHKILNYLTSWYWSFLDNNLLDTISKISSPEEKLKKAILLINSDFTKNEIIENINMQVLSRIIISESSKSYLTKEVDNSNKVGFYSVYKNFVNNISDIVLEINPSYKYSHTLISTIVEGTHHQKYFAKHLPSLTDFKKDSDLLAEFYTDMALTIIKK